MDDNLSYSPLRPVATDLRPNKSSAGIATFNA